MRAKEAAVSTGDPATIARVSRELSAEILDLLATLQIQTAPAQAEVLYRQALELQDAPDRRLHLAALLLRSGKATEAAGQAEQVTSADSTNSQAWALLGNALRAANLDEKAVDALTRSLELRSDPSVAYALASSLLAIRDKARAEPIFARLLEAVHEGAAMHVAIGDAYREHGYLPEAAEQFRLALARDPHVPHGEFFLGLVTLQMNQWGPNPESLLHLRRAVEQDPHDYLSNFYLGALEATAGSDLPSSDKHLGTAAAADSRPPEVWMYLGQNALREKHTGEARLYLRKAIALTGADEARNNYQIRRAYFTLGRLLLADGDQAEGERLLASYKRTQQAAVAESSAAIAHTSDEETAGGMEGKGVAFSALATSSVPAARVDLTGAPPDAAPSASLRAAEQPLKAMLAGSYNDLGTAEARQGQYPAALHDFQQAEQWDTPSPALLRNVGVAAYRVGDSHETERALSAYFASGARSDTRARLMLAMAEFDLGRFDEAAKNFTDASDLATSDPRTAYSYAFSLARSGHAQEANALADKLVTQGLPTDILALVCHVYFDAENYKGSNSCYREVSSRDATFRTAHYFVGESLIRLDEPAEAIPELREELALTPDEPNVRSALAFALLQTSHKEEARALLEQTVATHPEHADAQYQFGKLLLEEGKAAQAIPHLEASESRDASKDYVHYQLANAYRKTGRTSDAEREFHAYREIKDQHRNDRAVPQGQ